MPVIQQLGSFAPGIFVILLVAVLAVIQLSVREEFQRRMISGGPILYSAIAIISGLAVSKLVYAITFPSQFFDRPIFSIFHVSSGNFYDGLFGGIVVVILIARHYRVSTLAALDALSPIGACFAIYHPMPSLAPIWWLVVIVLQSRFFGRPSSKPRPDGLVFSIFLALIGAARFLVGYLTGDPSTAIGPIWLQASNLVCFALGVVFFVTIKSRFHKLSKEHRILDAAQQRGFTEQPESKSPTPECPHPERWRMYDAMTAEVEVLEFLKVLVTTLKPNLVVETGTFMGVSTLWIAEGLKQNGFGRVITCEFDPKTHAAAQRRFDESGRAEWIDLRLGSSLDLKIEGTIDILFSDSDLGLREQEVRRFLPQVNPNGVILMHDASSHLKTVREAALRLEQEGLISVLLLPTPRGLVIAQKRAGRK
jgi:predicted O-methyltransferase YrrM/prolipoprotein diacylglyceryltransferase